ncbi:MAG: hypothetical protein LLG16_02570 [Euryarchaeota archaeon]|nr:hypothetical protein [Euryarchaeota archaeon]
MTNKKIVGGFEKEIYLTALRHKLINVNEARDIAGNEATARMALWRLTTKGSLLRVKSGWYAAIPPEQVNTTYEIDRYLLFDRLMGSTGALAYHSALELHGVAHSSFSTVYYLSTKKRQPYEFQDVFYKPVWTSQLFGTMPFMLDDQIVQITDKERTFIDCIRRLDLSGGLEECLKSVEGFKLLRSSTLVDYLERFNEQSLYQRTGFVLDHLKDRIKVSDDLLDVLLSRVGKNVYYLIPWKKGNEGRLVKEWNILIPRNLEEMARYV